MLRLVVGPSGERRGETSGRNGDSGFRELAPSGLGVVGLRSSAGFERCHDTAEFLTRNGPYGEISAPRPVVTSFIDEDIRQDEQPKMNGRLLSLGVPVRRHMH
jgi:hypothetical protein